MLIIEEKINRIFKYINIIFINVKIMFNIINKMNFKFNIIIHEKNKIKNIIKKLTFIKRIKLII